MNKIKFKIPRIQEEIMNEWKINKYVDRAKNKAITIQQ
jgi:hypothetical protein